MHIKVERIDHLGVIAGVMHDLGLVGMIDHAIGTDKQELISVGEAVAGMVINGLGFVDQSLMLTPNFFEDKALTQLFGRQIDSSSFNRYKLSRTLDKIYEYGCEQLFSELAFKACLEEKVSLRYQHCDTTTFSLSGKYDKEMDGSEVTITHGYSKDHRADLKQVVQELIVSQDGGIPLATRTWSGNTSDSKVFKKRVRELVKIFQHDASLRCLIADSKLYYKDNVEQLKQLYFITRIPSTIKLETESIGKALQENIWQVINKEYKCRGFMVEHYAMQQRWTVYYSTHANERAKKSVERNAIQQESAIKRRFFMFRHSVMPVSTMRVLLYQRLSMP